MMELAPKAFVKEHQLDKDAYSVATPLTSFISLDYEGTSHLVVANKKLPDGSYIHPPIERLLRGVRIRVTYSMAPVADPLVNSLVPEIVKVELVGTGPELYEVTVQTPFGSQEDLRRMQQRLGDTGTVTGVRKIA